MTPTHRERAESLAEHLMLPTDIYTHLETLEEATGAEVIAREMYPTELVEALRELLDRTDGLSDTTSGQPSAQLKRAIDQARDALDLYKEIPCK
jgi:hypothetical protein